MKVPFNDTYIYLTGNSTVFYDNLTNYGGGTSVYLIALSSTFGDTGAEFKSTYSDSHSKVNDIIIHDPISAEFAMVIPLSEDRDQRTDSTKVLGGNLQESSVETITRLKDPLPRQNLVFNGDAEMLKDFKIVNWYTWEETEGTVTFADRITAPYLIAGLTSFELNTARDLNIKGSYFTTVTGIGEDAYSFRGKMSNLKCRGRFEITCLNSLDQPLGQYNTAWVNNSVAQEVTVNFQAPSGTTQIKVAIVKDNSTGVPGSPGREYLYADDLVLNDNTTTTWQPMSYAITESVSVPNPDYITPYQIPNPDYVAGSEGVPSYFYLTNGAQAYTVPVTGTYKLEVWGGQGGYYPGTPINSNRGGFASGNINLTAGETIYIYIGGKGTDALGSNDGGYDGNYSAGGWNGGGWGSGRGGPGGGGGTDIRRSGQAVSNRIIIAGGGGGSLREDPRNNGGQSGYGTYALFQGEFGCYSRHSSSYSNDEGGGGGGYYGGPVQHGDDPLNSSGGTSYTGSLSSAVMTSAVNAGNGMARITPPTIAGVGEPFIWVNNAHYNPTASSPSEEYNENVILGNQISDIIGIPAGTPWGGTYFATDVLVGNSKIYILSTSMNQVGVYNKNSDGSMGFKLYDRNWYSEDSLISHICGNASSVPRAYAIYVKDDVDYLVGWSGSSANIYQWTISSTGSVSIRQNYSAPLIMPSYSRGGWDGSSKVYFVTNGGSLYSWDIVTKTTTFVRTLSNFATYVSSSFTGSGLLVIGSKLYASSGANETRGLLSSWDINTGAYIATVRAYTLIAAGITPINGETGHISLTALHRNIAYYMASGMSIVRQIRLVGYSGTGNPVPTNFDYTGSVQTFTASEAGTYFFEVWGAQGGDRLSYDGGSANLYGGRGGYSKGSVSLAAGEIVYVYVGGQGSGYSGGNAYASRLGGWNGGGYANANSPYTAHGTSGGGATDIRSAGQALNNRVIVAGGGGGVENCWGPNGGAGGGLISPATAYASGATQSSGGLSYNNQSYATPGTFGQGGNGASSCASGGGGGWYGGSGVHGGSSTGGSGYIGGVFNGISQAGTESIYSPYGALEIGHAGNGYARITQESSTSSSETTDFSYNGAIQTFTAPTTGTYTIITAGASGGQGDGLSPGKGAKIQGDFQLTAGEQLKILVGQKGGDGTGGSSRAGGGGGGTFVVKAIGNAPLLIAGGGNGGPWASHTYPGEDASYNQGSNTLAGIGHYRAGGGAGFTGNANTGPASPFALSFISGGAGGAKGVNGGYGGFGGGGGAEYEGGGGGYSGGTPVAQNAYSSRGTSSTSYNVGTNKQNTVNTSFGNGYVTIIAPTEEPADPDDITNIPWIEGLSPTIGSDEIVVHTITNSPDDWYEVVVVVTPPMAPVPIPGNGTFVPGNFINLDYGFQVYLPNRGDFYGDNSYGLASLNKNRGRGFINSMNTTEWVKEKYVTFDFNVIYAGVGYLGGTRIPLDISDADGVYDFYCPLANSEAVSAVVTFEVIAINGTGQDNSLPANRERYNSYDARHSGIKRFNVDVVGRIGNLIMEDTGDYRFANLFKMAKVPTSWIVPGVVRDVALDQQNNIVGDLIDIRGVPVTAPNQYLNTYGLTSFANRNPVPFPLTPDKNNIAALRTQPLRIGYKSYLDVQTLGDYANGYIQIIPHYYNVNLSTNVITEVDVYMVVDGAYQPINMFGAAVPGWDPSIVYNNLTMLSWDDEFARRNYSATERARTEQIASAYKTYDASGNVIDLPTPLGKYHAYGNNQLLQLTGRNRTFIGTSMVCNQYNANPGNVFNDLWFGKQAQRWHFTTGLPSSSVVVRKGLVVNQTNVDILKTKNSVLLLTLDIKSVGESYILQYKGDGQNSSVTIAGATRNLGVIPFPIIAVMSATKTSGDDLDTSGTH